MSAVRIDDQTDSERIELCNSTLGDPGRLAALDETGLMGSLQEESFDRLTRLAAKILNAPLSIVSFVGKDEQFFKSFYGLPEPWASNPSIPIGNSVCRFTLSGTPLLIENANNVAYLDGNPAIPALNLVAYMGVPLLNSDGKNLGAFCVVDYKVRKWTQEELEILKELTQSIMTEIDLRVTGKRLQNTVESLTAERELREKFVMTLTHDLRNPLSAAKLSAQMIKRKPGDAVNADKLADRIGNSLARADSMIQSLLDISRIQGGESFPLNLQECYLNEIAETAVKEMNGIFGERCTFKTSSAVKGSWSADGLQRICENLISNALKYGSASQPVTVSVKSENGQAILTVHNFGNPIPLASQEKLFDAFHRTEDAQKGGQKGWGLGLTLVEGMSKAMNGSVTVESTAELGTTFKVSLPITP